MESNRRKLAIATSVSFAGSIITALLSYPRNWSIARALGTEKLGIFSLAGTIVGLVSTVFGLGLHQSISKYISQCGDNITSIRGSSRWTLIIGIISGIVSTILVILTSGIFADRLFDNRLLAPVLVVVSFGIPFTIMMNISCSILLGMGKVIYSVAVNNIILPMVWTSLIVLVWYFNLGIYIMSWTMSLSLIVAALFALWFVVKTVGRGKSELIGRDLLDIVNTGIALFVSSFAYSFWLRMDVLFLGYFGGANSVGVYTPAFQTSYLLNYLIVAVSSLFSPTVAKLYFVDSKEELNNLYKEMSQWCFYGNMSIAITLFFGAEPFLRFFGRDFVTNDAVTSLRVLLTGFLIYSLFGAMSAIMLAMGGVQKALAKLEIGMIIISSSLYLLLTPNYGVIGTACAASGSLVIVSVLRVMLVIKKTGYSNIDKHIWKSIVVLLGAGLATFVVNVVAKNFNPIFRLGFLAITAILSELTMLLIVREPVFKSVINAIKKNRKMDSDATRF